MRLQWSNDDEGANEDEDSNDDEGSNEDEGSNDDDASNDEEARMKMSLERNEAQMTVRVRLRLE